MDYLQDLGALALASRMKRLVGKLNRDVKSIYAAQHVQFEPLLMPITRLLQTKDKLRASEIAAYLGVSQPAVTQMCNALKKYGVITVQRHPKDHRIRQVALRSEGRDVVRALEPVWREIERAVQQMMEGADNNLLHALEAFESRYDQKTLEERVLEQLARREKTHVAIVLYTESLKGAFKRLNYEWIKKHFSVEPSDRRVLSNPKKHVIDQGGYIYFAQSGNEVVGTYALMRIGAHVYEIAKMAVAAAHQKHGIGTTLLDHAIGRARDINAHRLVLYSNTLLAPAINLYFKKGFRVVPKDDYHNQRANIKMELQLKRRTESSGV